LEYIKYTVDYSTSFEEINHPDSPITIRISGEHHNLLTKRINCTYIEPRKKTQNTMATHEVQGSTSQKRRTQHISRWNKKKLMKIKTSTWKETKIKDLRKKEKKASQREKTKRPEAIWTRPSGLKFFQIEEMKINDEELEEQGKGDFF